MMRKSVLSLLLLGIIVCCCGCSFMRGGSGEVVKDKFSVAMVTDTGGVNDQSFNMSSWQGICDFTSRTGSVGQYIESKQSSDYYVNIDRLADEKFDLIWGIGFSLADVIKWGAQTNPELSYAIVDYSFGDEILDNVTSVVFRAQEAAFMVGYAAGRTTKTGKVGFVGGITSMVIDQFDYGFRAGVDHAAKELQKDITVKVQYADSFSDAAKGKAIALNMFFDGCDVVFHAAGGVGVGVIEAAKESGNYAIGVDRDQAYLAPSNVLTSATKNVGKAVDMVSDSAMKGEKIGGKILSFGIKEDCVGIPQSNPNLDPKVYMAVMAIKDKIAKDEIIPPYNLKTYKQFRNSI